MKLYDIALVLVRVLVVVDVIRDLADLLISVVSSAVVFGTLWSISSPVAHELEGTMFAKALSLGRVSGAVLEIVVDLIILAAAPRIARFTTRFAGSDDAAARP